MSGGVPVGYDVAIVGGGAAGLMCAIEAGKRGRRAAVLEHNGRIGEKILISGGGRCNFTNVHARPEHFHSANPHFAKSALARYTPRDFIRLVEKHGIPYHEKTAGQLFCDRSASDITDMLEAECARAGVQIITGGSVREVRREDGFFLETNRGGFRAESLVIATGGLSIPKIGASDFGYRVARQFGLKIVPCRPALVPLTFGESDRRHWAGLAGVSAEVIASFGQASFREKMLFTHRGLSGPAVLQISSYWEPGSPLSLDLAPGRDVASELAARKARGERGELKNILAEYLPRRLAERWAELHGGSRPLAGMPDRQLAGIGASLHRWAVTPGGTEGYGKAEVTAGGVDTGELSSQTCEARNVSGLYFIGEVVDVTGHLGGFNFQWAWASGYAAGQYA